MGGAPRRPPGLPILLLLLSLAGSGAACDGDKFNFQLDLPPEEEFHCPGAPWPIPPQVSSRVTKTSQAEHRGVAFLYHPCAHPLLRAQLALLARACLPHHLLTPRSGLSQERPLALVAWGATLHMAQVDVAQGAAWLRRHVGSRRRAKSQPRESYRHLLRRQAVWAAGREVCPRQRLQVLQGHFQSCQRNRISRKLLAFGQRQGGLRLPPPRGAVANSRPAAEGSLAALAPATQGAGKDVLKRANAQRQSAPPEGRLKEQPPQAGQGNGSALLVRPAEEGAAPPLPGCQCPERGLDAAQEKARVPTPRTGEAAWAASALTFLLVVLMLAVLYTRLHQNCRRGRSLYWTSSEEGRDTVAAVIKRRLLAGQSRRKKRSRQQQKPLLPVTMSSESSD